MAGVGGALGVLRAANAALSNADVRKIIEISGAVIAELTGLQQLDAFYKKKLLLAQLLQNLLPCWRSKPVACANWMCQTLKN